MQTATEHGVTIRIESISSVMASELLSKSHSSVSEILAMDSNKIAHFMSVMCGKGGGWYPTMSTIWIGRDGKLRDGFHRLQAVASLGCTIEVLVARGADYTPEHTKAVERVIEVAREDNPQFELRRTVPGSVSEVLRNYEESEARESWAENLAVRLLGGKKRRLKGVAVRLLVGMMRLSLCTGRARGVRKARLMDL